MQLFPGHYCVGYITYEIYCFVFGTVPTIPGIALGIIFALLPDFDIILYLKDLMKGDKSKQLGTTFRHHEFPSHYPILYSPFIILAVLLPHPYTITMVTAVYLHLLFDTFYTSNGIKWLYPFKNEFYLLFSEKTKNKHGVYWEKAYKTTIMFRLEFILLAVAGLIFWWNHYHFYRTPTWSVILIGILIVCFFFGSILVERWRARYTDKLIAEAKEKL